jgi:hypothetical protein
MKLTPTVVKLKETTTTTLVFKEETANTLVQEKNLSY